MNWKHRVNIKDHVYAAVDGGITIQEAGRRIARTLEESGIDLDGIEDVLEEMPSVSDEEEADFLLEQLYEWGDNTRVFLGP